MTQEEKQLVLKDLCARLPYKPKIKVLSLRNENREAEENIVDSVYCVMLDGYINTETIDSDIDISLDDIVLYLRPMSSMSEDEINELSHYGNSLQRTDFFYSHHIDCRFMIEKGLALEAPEGMYNIPFHGKNQ